MDERADMAAEERGEGKTAEAAVAYEPESGRQENADTLQPAPEGPDGTEPLLSSTELTELRKAYPNADAEQDMNDPAFRALVCGEVRPTLRQVYELFHRDQLTEAAIENAVADALAREVPAAVETAVAEAVAQAEAHLLEDIRLRGARPVENGVGAAGVVASHPSVDRLTRSERAQLARRAEHGERIRL